MDIIRPLARVWLSYEFGVLDQNTGKFSRGAGCLSGLISRTL
jgi:hypothetical protein